MPAVACPPAEELSSLLLGRLPPAEAELVEQHVETCVDCQNTVKSLNSSGDWLADGVRAAIAEAILEPACQEAIARIRKHAPEATAATLAAVPKTTAAEAEKQPSKSGAPDTAASHDLGTIREYQLLSKLGEGGMGAVYKAQHTKLRRTVALKLLPAAVANSPAVIARFEREMQAVGALDHQHIVRAFDAGESEGRHYLVMEYVKGRDLTQLCRDCGRLSIADACELIRQSAVGLQHAHEAGLVHRDLKPSNLMLSDAGVVKILDLGLALLNNADGSGELTSTGQVMGTIDYMAPEQGGDTHHVDIRADIYSLGATLYRLLTGVAPFGDPKFDTPVKKLMALATQEPVPAPQRRSDIPPVLAAVIAKMLAKSPDKRYATPAELAAALAPFAAGSNLPALATRAGGEKAPPLTRDVETQPSLKSASVDTIFPSLRPAPRGAGYWNRFQQLPFYVRWLALTLVGLVGGGGFAWALSGIVLQWQTPNGTVRIEILDDKIRAKFDKDGLTISGADKEPIKVVPALAKPKAGEKALSAGPHKLIITRGDFSFETDSFDLKKNGKITIKIELVANKVIATADGKTIGEKSFGASLAGKWTSGGQLRQSDFGTIELVNEGNEYHGTYSATYDKKPGKLRLKSVGERKFEGSWSESNLQRIGLLQAELSADDQTLHVIWEAADDEYTKASPAAKRGVSQWKRVRQAADSSEATRGPSDAGEFVRMFNDTDLTGWQPLRSGSIRWTNEKGLITGRNRLGTPNSAGVLQSMQHYKDFHFRCEMLAGVSSEPAILFRNVGNLVRGSRHGYALANPAPTSPTIAKGWGYGSLYADNFQVPLSETRLAPSAEKDLGIKTGDWYRLEIIAQGEAVEIRINGKRTARYTSNDPALNRPGAFAIRCGAGETVALRNVEIKDVRPVELEGTEDPAVSPTTSSESSESVAATPGAQVPRKANLYTVKPYWSINGGELLFGSNEFSHQWILFGDKNWTDYDFQAQVLRLRKGSPSGGVSLLFRSEGPNFTNTGLFGFGSKGIGIAFNRGGKEFFSHEVGGVAVPSHTEPGDKLVNNRWYTLKVEVRGSTVRSFLDGRPVVTFDKVPFAKGKVGLHVNSATYRIREIQVTAPDGSSLWNGPPELPASPLPVPKEYSAAGSTEGDSAAVRTSPPPAIAPFDAAQAKAHQDAWAKHLGVPVEYTNSIGMKFRLIPPAEYLRGSDKAEADAIATEAKDNQGWRDQIQSETPQHRVVLSRPIYLGVHEVTQKQYEQVVGKNPSEFTSAKQKKVLGKTDNFPVDTVSWGDAASFCRRLGEMDASDGSAYSLPTEAQWEFACRAGSTATYPTGNVPTGIERHGWTNAKSDWKPHPVGGLTPNAFGLFDMYGNAWEWVEDRWDPQAYAAFAEKTAVDPVGSRGNEHMVRGGSWRNPPASARAASRSPIGEPYRHAFVGFRAALSVEAVKAKLRVAPPRAIAPFDAAQANAHQEAWAKHLGLPVEISNSLGMKFRLVPPGEFLMGSTQEEIEAALTSTAGIDNKHLKECIQSEGPRHKVTLTQPFYLGVHEVTQTLYEKLQGGNPSHFAAAGEGKDAVAGIDTTVHPVEMVNWEDAQDFCAKLNGRDKLVADPAGSGGYRLPTEAQWEFACRAGTTALYSTGNDEDGLQTAAWYSGNSGGRTHAVGTRKANPFGLHDMHGNVYEWTLDVWEPTYYQQFAEKVAMDPSGSSSEPLHRVIRGGDWLNWPTICRSAYRYGTGPGDKGRYLGFRVAMTVEGARQLLCEQASASALPAEAPADSGGATKK